MYPYITIGKFQIPVFGLMMLAGMIAAFIIILKNRKYQPYDDDDLSNVAIIAILSGFVGSKLLYWLVEIKTIIANPHFLLESITAGFVFYGALIGGVLGLLIYIRKKKHMFFSYSDLILPAFMVGQGFGRIGCFFAGCCYGKLTTSAFSVTFPAGSACAGTRIPTQLMECAFCIICGLALMVCMRKEKKYGLATSLYLILYGVWRFFIEFFRGDERGSVGALSTSQFIGIFIVLAGIACLIVYKKGITKEKQMQKSTAPDGEIVDEKDELSTENVDNPTENVDKEAESAETEGDNSVEEADKQGNAEEQKEAPEKDEGAADNNSADEENAPVDKDEPQAEASEEKTADQE